jgi:SAM-dependent methyltransferase
MDSSVVAWFRRHAPDAVKRRIRDLIERGVPDSDDRIRKYLRDGRVPWSPGYSEYKRRYVLQLLGSEEFLRPFREGAELPAGHGERLDERVVEYPWLFSRSNGWGVRVLDAGSTLNFPEILSTSYLRDREVIVYNLKHGWMASDRHVSYISGDLRDMILRDDIVDLVVCISTLEHIGLDNTRLYTGDVRYREHRPDDYRRALREFRRVLRPGGRLMVTVPFGKATVLGWLQQFDRGGVEEIVRGFDGTVRDISYFKYEPTGWRRASAAACAECEYFDVHAGRPCDTDYAAAARAVACLDLEKPPS